MANNGLRRQWHNSTLPIIRRASNSIKAQRLAINPQCRICRTVIPRCMLQLKQQQADSQSIAVQSNCTGRLQDAYSALSVDHSHKPQEFPAICTNRVQDQVACRLDAASPSAWIFKSCGTLYALPAYDWMDASSFWNESVAVRLSPSGLGPNNTANPPWPTPMNSRSSLPCATGCDMPSAASTRPGWFMAMAPRRRSTRRHFSSCIRCICRSISSNLGWIAVFWLPNGRHCGRSSSSASRRASPHPISPSRLGFRGIPSMSTSG